MRIHRLLLAGLTACAAAPPVTPAQPLSAAEHRAQADEHDQRASRHGAAAQEQADDVDGYACGDTVLADQATTGGERLGFAMPCWNTHAEASYEHRRAAEHERSEAMRHRALARELEIAEREKCAGLPANELDHTPFWHRADVARVERIVEGGRLRGARVTFRPVAGLTVDWLRHALQCHRARAATLGWTSTYMGYDPSVLAAATTSVTANGKDIAVEIVSNDPDVAAVIAGRAEALTTDVVTPGRADPR